MLNGEQLGAAIEAAREAKGVSKKEMAEHFGVKPPSIQDWVNRGVISKGRLVDLWIYFADVCGPEHWGLQEIWPGHRFEPQPTKSANVVRVEDAPLAWPFERLSRAEWFGLDALDRAFLEGAIVQMVKQMKSERGKRKATVGVQPQSTI